MKQRVGIAVALAMKPKVLLLDEPFGALDALTRAHLQDAVMQIQQSLNTTIVMITHDVDEAVLLSDRVLMMTNGPAATVGEILDVNLPRPRNRVQLADDSRYHHLRQQILHFLYENSRKQHRGGDDAATGDYRQRYGGHAPGAGAGGAGCAAV